MLHNVWKFLDPAENNLAASDALGTFLNGFRNGLNMAVNAVIDDEYFHVCSFVAQARSKNRSSLGSNGHL